MKRYFNLCLKRTARFFPFVLTVSLVLFLGLTLILNAFFEYQSTSEDVKRFKVGVVGEDETGYLSIGMTALQDFDAVRFAVELVELDEQKAEKSLKRGDISAYIVIPENFVSKAMRGEILSIKYVTTPGSVGLISMFKDELTAVISDIVEQSQRGVYGIDNALDENGHSDVSYEKMNKLNIQFIKFILARTNMYSVEELGIGEGETFFVYMFCGATVVFMFLTCLIYSPLFVKRDISLNKVLKSKQRGILGQVLSEYTAFVISLVVLYLTVFSLLAIISKITPVFERMGDIEATDILLMSIRIIPAVLAISSMSFLIFEICSNIVAGVLMQFLFSLFLCYASGCLYPIYALPVSLQKLSVFSPAAISRGYISMCFTGETDFLKILYLLLFSAAFIALAIGMRAYKITGKRG